MFNKIRWLSECVSLAKNYSFIWIFGASQFEMGDLQNQIKSNSFGPTSTTNSYNNILPSVKTI